ncbi:MAG: hypothetical protein IKX67_10535 [Bacteroidales bacterium]|nr:hypothetical protein [Bacteroidales bacterium]
MKADKVILGNIYTVDRNQPKAQAAAIAGGKEGQDLQNLPTEIFSCWHSRPE